MPPHGSRITQEGGLRAKSGFFSQIRKSYFSPKCDPIFADFDCEWSKDFFENVARRLAPINFESDCVDVRIPMPLRHEI